MSGPKTSHYRLRANRKQEDSRRQAEERQRREVLAARVAAATVACSALKKRTAKLADAVRDLQTSFPQEIVNVVVPKFAAPKSEDPQRIEDYVAKIESDLAEAESVLRKAGEQAKANKDFRSATQSAAELCSGAMMSAEEVMQRFLESTKSNVTKKSIRERRTELARILGRYGADDWNTASPTLEHLVIEAISTESEERFSGLTTEIRRQIQELKKTEANVKADAKKAKTLIEHLELKVPTGEEQLKQRLELVRVGAIAFPADIEAEVGEAIAKAGRADRRRTQDTASGIIKGTLVDLGYDVSPIEETLFVSGGKVYFRKPGWNDYCVRLTVRPDESKINFNVVKVADQSDTGSPSTRAADIEAENAWCSGYQQLVDTLKARGLETELTRHLAVGAVPVPVIVADEISSMVFGAPTKKRQTAPKTKIIKGNVK